MASDDDLYDEMDEFLAGDLPAETEGIELPQAEDADQANRYLRARQRLLRDQARVEDVVDAEIARLRAFRDDRTAGIRGRVEHLDRLLEGWMRAVHAAEPDRKTEKLPNGELRLRAGSFRVEVTDGDALAGWLWANDPSLLDVRFPPKLGELKGRVATDPRKHKDRPLRLGPVMGEDPDGECWWQVVTGDGEAIPGVRLAKDKRDRFSVH